MSIKPNIYDLNYEQINEIISSKGYPSYRAKQIWLGLYRSFWNTPDEFTNLPNNIKQFLENNYSFGSLNQTDIHFSKDHQTTKILFSGPNNAILESVLMRYTRRRTACISSQSGCAMRCVFCATGQMGFNRNLSNGEIVEQVLYFARHLNKEDDRLTNVVIMGMGEPFLNYKATMTAIDRLNNPDGFNFGARRITISTVGIVPGIQKFTSEKRQVNLSISLHAADNTLRSSLMPINNKYPLQELMKACGDYIKHTRRRLSFEWALIENVNDGVAQAKKLVKLIKGLELVHVNLIPLNPTHGYAGRGSSYEKAKSFSRILEDNKIPVTIRIRRGLDIHAGCGQLASSHSKDSLLVDKRKI